MIGSRDESGEEVDPKTVDEEMIMDDPKFPSLKAYLLQMVLLVEDLIFTFHLRWRWRGSKLEGADQIFWRIL